MESERKDEKAPANHPGMTPSKMGEIVMYTDHIPTREEIHEARKQQIRDARALRGE